MSVTAMEKLFSFLFTLAKFSKDYSELGPVPWRSLEKGPLKIAGARTICSRALGQSTCLPRQLIPKHCSHYVWSWMQNSYNWPYHTMVKIPLHNSWMRTSWLKSAPTSNGLFVARHPPLKEIYKNLSTTSWVVSKNMLNFSDRRRQKFL